MRTVLDTNVLISAMFLPGTAHRCLAAAEAGLYDLVLAEPILDELRDKLISKFHSTRQEADVMIESLRRLGTLVQLAGQGGWAADDPDDDKFVETALVGRADAIVSGNHHLREMGVVESVPVLSPREFLGRLRQESVEA